MDTFAMGVAMLILTLVAVLIGVVLGLRFRVFVLVPVICGGLAIIVVDGVARGNGFLQLAFAMIATVAALQLGYFLGNVVVGILSAAKASNHHGAAVPSPTEPSRQPDSRMRPVAH
jgi:hypothetical protein